VCIFSGARGGNETNAYHITNGGWKKKILIPSGTIIEATIVKNLEVHAQGGNDTK